MIHSLEIKNYRGFSRFKMSGLGRINLLVGTNNSGKTSVLESLYLLAANGSPEALWQIVSRRGERLDSDSNRREPEPELDISHLFHGHELAPGVSFSFLAENQSPTHSISFTVKEVKRKEGPVGSRLVLNVERDSKTAESHIQLTRRGGLSPEIMETPRRILKQDAERESEASQFISTDSISALELASAWDTIVLTSAEEQVLRALRFLEPKIERIAPVANRGYHRYFDPSFRGAFLVKLKGTDRPVPIGSLGGGMWRMLAMAITLSKAKDSLLLVDEIDTGLHYTVMSDMWRFIAETSKSLNLQVFATTHSHDCVTSLASICRTQPDSETEVSIQRIEPEHSKAVKYTEAQIITAAERNIEVR